MCTVLRLKRTSYAFQRQPNSDGDGGSGGAQKREQRYFLSDLPRRTVIVKDCCYPGSHYYQYEGGDVHDKDFGFDQFDRGNNVDDVLNHFPKVKYHCSNWQE